MKATSFQSARLILRPFTADDTALLQQIDSDPEVVRYLGTGKVKSPQESQKVLEKILADYTVYGLSLFATYDDKQFIGRCGLIPWIIDGELHYEVGYSFIRQAWGKGYATEVATLLAAWAQDNLSVTHVISIIHPENRKSIHVAEKVGMIYSRPFELNGKALSIYRLDFKK